MHETAIADSLITLIIAEAEKQNARPVKAKISCGVLNTVNDEIMKFAFDAIGKGTLCEGIQVDIEHKPITGRCLTCGCEFVIDMNKPACTSCQSSDFEMLPDAPLLLEQIEFESQ